MSTSIGNFTQTILSRVRAPSLNHTSRALDDGDDDERKRIHDDVAQVLLASANL